MNDFSECYGLPEKLISNQEKANELSAGCSVSFRRLLGIFSEITRYLFGDYSTSFERPFIGSEKNFSKEYFFEA